MADISPAWKIRKSGTNYEVSDGGSIILYRPNGFSQATMVFDDTFGDVTNVFSPEDEIEIYIGDHTVAANKMMTGYITDISDDRQPSRRNLQNVSVVDWGAYLAGKTIFEKDYLRTKTASAIIADGVAEISGLSSNITALNTSAENMKRKFNGTYVKDLFNAVSENAGADYYFDEAKVLQFFGHGARDLDESTTGLIYKIKDVVPVSADTLMVDHNFPYKFRRNVDNRFRSVTITNGITETYPVDIDLYQIVSFKDDEAGKTFSQFYQRNPADFDIDVTTTVPVQLFSSTDVGGGLVMPTIRVLSADAAEPYPILLRGIEVSDDGSSTVLQDIGLVPTDWQRIAFYMKNALSGVTMTSLNIRLYDGGADFWERDIILDLNTTNWTYVAYDLPANLIDSPSNGWTKTGSPTVINRIGIEPSPTTGWTAKTYLEIGKFHFFRRRRSTVTGSGTPATEKIMIDATAKSITSLDTIAAKEQAIANQIAKIGTFTIEGNIDFKDPAYNIEVDFTASLGTGRSGTVIMNEIRHTLSSGRHNTQISFEPTFWRG